MACPCCGSHLIVDAQVEKNGEIETGTLLSEKCKNRYEIRNFVPRFVPTQTYADNFGLQWNCFRRTQLDSYSGQPISRERFFKYTGFEADELKGKFVLDVGCGAGRFVEVALASGATVVALDYSSAVDACWQNHSSNPSLHVVQGDIYALPFKAEQFDFVYCLGVLQHTPNVRSAFHCLPRQLKPGGRLAIDLYAWLWRNIFESRYWLRPITRRIKPEVLFALTKNLVPMLLPLSRAIGRLPGIGLKLRHVMPIANYEGRLPLTPQQIREWAILDTYDMLAPAHDHPQKLSTVQQWFEDAGLEKIEVFRSGFVVGRGTKPPR